jgi:hypothetical protein
VLSNIDKISSPIKKNVLGVFVDFLLDFLSSKNLPLSRNDNLRVGTRVFIYRIET